MGLPPILANLIGYAFAFGVMFLVWRKPLTAWWSRARAESARHAEEHGKVVQFPGADAPGVALHSTGNADLDAMENDIHSTSSTATATAGQGTDISRAKTDRWAAMVNDALIVLFVAGAIRAWVLWPFVGPLALANWFSIPFAVLLVALVVVYARHGQGEHFSYASGRLLAHEVRGLWLKLTHAHPSHLREHAQKRADLVLEAHQARERDQEIHRAQEFRRMMEMRVERGRQALETAMERAVGLHETRKVMMPHRVEVKRPDGSAGWKTEMQEHVSHPRIAHVRGRLVDLRAVYDLQWVGAYDAKVAQAWEKLCQDATLVLRMAIGDITPERIEYRDHTGELAVDLMSQHIEVGFPEEMPPEIEDEPSDMMVDLETPIAVGRPPVALLSTPNRRVSGRKNEGKTASEVILRAMGQAGLAGCELVEILPGPVVSTIIVKTPVEASASKVLGMEGDLRYRTGLNLRLEQATGYPGCIALEVPNGARATVSLAEVVGSQEFRSEPAKGEMIATVGVGTTGKPILTNVAKWPHALIGGTNGGGKSVLINALLLSLLLRYGPEDLRFLMVDPKRVELAPYARLPHLLAPPVKTPADAVPAFKWLVSEMTRRYELMEAHGVRELAKLNALLPKEERLPRIVIVVDEARELMENKDSRDAVIDAAKSLAGMARASGVHMWYSTQKPTVQVVETTIKGNLSTRIALRVITSAESGVILDEDGAQDLLGQGDLLMKDSSGKVVRAQSPFVQDDEIEKVVAWWADRQPQRFDPSLMQALGMGSGVATAPASADRTGTSTRPRLVVVRDDEEEEEEEQEEPETSPTSPADPTPDTEDGDPNWYDADDSNGGDDGNG